MRHRAAAHQTKTHRLEIVFRRGFKRNRRLGFGDFGCLRPARCVCVVGRCPCIVIGVVEHARRLVRIGVHVIGRCRNSIADDEHFINRNSIVKHPLRCGEGRGRAKSERTTVHPAQRQGALVRGNVSCWRRASVPPPMVCGARTQLNAIRMPADVARGLVRVLHYVVCFVAGLRALCYLPCCLLAVANG